MQFNKQFSNLLFSWYSTVDREMPWKDEQDVFYIWLSEIILQQTRVEQGKPYFLKFKERFKNVVELAEVSDEELMKLWQGLGYYSRARNLHAAAKQVVGMGGEFPKSYEGLLKLKGVGPYTAAAIASFAYNLPTPVIDGNVKRVISRIFGIADPIDTKPGNDRISQSIEKIFDSDNPSKFNQAIMDFGALVCKPKSPLCSDCPFQESCQAFIQDSVSELPIKSKKIIRKNRTFHYFILELEESYYIRKRKGKDIWKHLHDFPMIENEAIDISNKKELMYRLGIQSNFSINHSQGPFKHILTHQNLYVYFHHGRIEYRKLEKPLDYFLVSRKNLMKFAFPKIIDWYLIENSIYLNKNYIK